MQYTVIETETIDELINEVNKRSVLGWRPVGGVAVSCLERTNDRKGYKEIECTYSQALVAEGECIVIKEE